MPSAAELGREELHALIDVSRTVNASLKWDEVLESIMSVTTRVMKVEASSLLLLNEEGTELSFQVARGDKSEIVKTLRVKVGEGIAGWVAQEKKPAIVNDVQSDPRFTRTADKTTGFKTKGVLCVPMQTQERFLGVIEVINRLDGREFSDHDQLLCEAIASQASIALENARLHEERIRQERLAAIGQTVAGLAHCIKNILNALGGGAYIVDDGLDKGDLAKVGNGWEIVKSNNQFLSQLVLDMLTYSKEREPEYAEVDINDVCISVQQLCKEMARKKKARVIFEGDPSIGFVKVDETGIKRCLINLVGNALDACEEEGGVVRITTGSADEAGRFFIRVEDNGCGVPDEHKQKLFQAFFSTKRSKGSGLGLPVTHKVITEHRGRIDVESKEGKGTTFLITLPKQPPETP